MKKTLTAILILFCLSGMAQRVTILDTTYNGQRHIYNCNYGDIRTTIDNDTLTEIIIHIRNKQRVVASGDTMQRAMNIRIPYSEVKERFDLFMNSNAMQRAIRRALKDDYKKKISAE